jgi:hypothetical protein
MDFTENAEDAKPTQFDFSSYNVCFTDVPISHRPAKQAADKEREQRHAKLLCWGQSNELFVKTS